MDGGFGMFAPGRSSEADGPAAVTAESPEVRDPRAVAPVDVAGVAHSPPPKRALCYHGWPPQAAGGIVALAIT